MLTPKRTHAQMPMAAAVLSNLDKLRQSVRLPKDAPGLPAALPYSPVTR